MANQNRTALGSGDALTATGQSPPLYYALEAIPYKLTPSSKVLDELMAMRLLSALMGALTVLLVFLFLRELLPALALGVAGRERSPWRSSRCSGSCPRGSTTTACCISPLPACCGLSHGRFAAG